MMLRLLAALMLFLCFPGARADTANVDNSLRLLDFGIARTAIKPQDGGVEGLDIDGDGLISKAEAAGHAEVTQAFDRADRNRDGRISTAEWQRYERWVERRAKARAAREARESASAGGTAKSKRKKRE